MRCHCGGTIETYESRGHEKAGCSRCHRCVGISELLNRADAPRPPVLQGYQASISAWFREVAALENRYREHLQVKLTAQQCLEVARIIDGGITMFSCDVDESEQTGVES